MYGLQVVLDLFTLVPTLYIRFTLKKYAEAWHGYCFFEEVFLTPFCSKNERPTPNSFKRFELVLAAYTFDDNKTAQSATKIIPILKKLIHIEKSPICIAIKLAKKDEILQTCRLHNYFNRC